MKNQYSNVKFLIIMMIIYYFEILENVFNYYYFIKMISFEISYYLNYTKKKTNLVITKFKLISEIGYIFSVCKNMK